MAVSKKVVPLHANCDLKIYHPNHDKKLVNIIEELPEVAKSRMAEYKAIEKEVDAEAERLQTIPKLDEMKKLICVVFMIMLGLGQVIAKDCSICSGTSQDIAYTVRGNYVYYGTSQEIAYTIRDNYICKGTSNDVAYTIRGNYICYGTSQDAAYTIRSSYICSGTSQYAVFTIR